MSFTYDRLYGRLDLHGLIGKLVRCPGLLRLCWIGMGNVRFLGFPSFSAVTRYEHSLGVCHLAELASQTLRLNEKDRTELMIAALYHDVTTPPFAHAMEEILKSCYGFDHEQHFNDLIIGRSRDTGKYYAQIFEGKTLILPTLTQSAEGRRIGIDLFRIPKLVFGHSDDVLSSLISSDIDLDNIDNVVRAASAMGVRGADGNLAEMLARSFVPCKDGRIAISQDSKSFIEKWKNLRRTLYNMILCSVEDFSLQTMLKDALYCLIKSSDEKLRLHEEDWKMTEENVIKRIQAEPSAHKIYKRMLLRDLYICLDLVWIEGKGALNSVQDERRKLSLEKLCGEILNLRRVSLNYYQDKRQREVRRLFVLFDETSQPERRDLGEPGVLVGFFSPDRFGWKSKADEKKSTYLQLIKRFNSQLRNKLPNSVSLHEVMISTRGTYPEIQMGEEIK